MNFLGKSIIITLINALAIYLADSFIPSFNALKTLDSLENLYSLIIIALILTVLNFTIKPLLQIALFPVALLTFGLSSLAINAGILFILDYLREDVIINGLVPLVIGAIFISFINLICQRLLLPKS